MNAVKCSVMTGQHDRSFIFHTVKSLNANAHDNEDFLADMFKTNLVMNAIFSVFMFIAVCMYTRL